MPGIEAGERWGRAWMASTEVSRRSTSTAIFVVCVVLSCVGGVSANGIDLVVTGILEDGDAAVAVLEDRGTQQQRMYRIGDAAGRGRITKILPDRVILTIPEGEVELRLGTTTTASEPARHDRQGLARPAPATPASAPSTDIAGGGPRVLKRAVVAHLSRAPELLLQVEPVGDSGVRLGEVLPGDLLDSLGLKTGDIVRDVNMRRPGTAVSLSEIINQALQQEHDVVLRVQIERSGRPESLYIPVRR